MSYPIYDQFNYTCYNQNSLNVVEEVTIPQVGYEWYQSCLSSDMASTGSVTVAPCYFIAQSPIPPQQVSNPNLFSHEYEPPPTDLSMLYTSKLPAYNMFDTSTHSEYVLADENYNTTIAPTYTLTCHKTLSIGQVYYSIESENPITTPCSTIPLMSSDKHECNEELKINEDDDVFGDEERSGARKDSVKDNVLASLVNDELPHCPGDAKAMCSVKSSVSFSSDSSVLDEVTDYSVEVIQGLEHMEHVADLEETDSIKSDHKSAGVDCISITQGKTPIDYMESKQVAEGLATMVVKIVGEKNVSDAQGETVHKPDGDIETECDIIYSVCEENAEADKNVNIDARSVYKLNCENSGHVISSELFSEEINYKMVDEHFIKNPMVIYTTEEYGEHIVTSDVHGTRVILLQEMNPRGLIYSFVAKGTIVLAEHTSYSGNFSTIAVQCLQKLPSGSSKYTYSCDGHTFNFLIDTGFVFLVVADESTGRSVPFVFLERVKDDFKQRYGASINSDSSHPLADNNDDEDDYLFQDRFSIAYNLDRKFRPKLKEHMEYCMNHPDEMSKLSKLKAHITEVKGIMMDNIERVLDRGVKIELLVDKTENLQFQDDVLWLMDAKEKWLAGIVTTTRQFFCMYMLPSQILMGFGLLHLCWNFKKRKKWSLKENGRILEVLKNLPKLLNEFMATVSGGFVSRLNLATCEVVPDTKALAKGILDILLGDVPKGVKVQTKHLEALMTGSFARNIRHLFSEIDLKILMETLEAVVGVGSEWLAFVSKRGQIMLSASTLFPSEHVKEFQYYFDRAHAVPFEKIPNSMREEFYEFDDGVFEFVDPTLVTSASIAQVHGVRFRGFPEGVVIEAWNPGIKDILVAGLNLVFVVARILEILNTDLSRISLVGIVVRLDISGKKNVQIFDAGGCIILTSLRTSMFLRGRNCNELGVIGPSGLVAMTNWSPCQVKPKGA